MTVSLTVYGATDCEDTARTRGLLKQLGIAFIEVNIDDDKSAEDFVIFINNGFRRTPTVVIAQNNEKLVVTEPSDSETEAILRRSGLLPHGA